MRNSIAKTAGNGNPLAKGDCKAWLLRRDDPVGPTRPDCPIAAKLLL